MRLKQMSKWRIDIHRLAWPIGVDYLARRIYGGFVMRNGNGGTGLVREERLQIMLSP
jgi:hypothetical protein